VKDIFPGTASSNPAFLGFTNNTLFFTCDNGSIGRELWRSDGTLAGTFLLIELNPGSGSCNIKENTTFQNNFIFRHTLSAMPVNDHVLWQSD
jgi:ELWxxDGT repeat protein